MKRWTSGRVSGMARRRLLLWIVVAAVGPIVSTAYALPNVVYVFNGGEVGYEGLGEGFAWQEAGFLDDKGKPLTKNGKNLVNTSGAVVGMGIMRGGDLIGWENQQTGVAIVDIDVGTFNDAFSLVSMNGTIRTYKHGSYLDTNMDGSYTEGIDRLGGYIRLDKGELFGGFGKGTGVQSDPYDLPARSGAAITLELIGCWVGLDPDGTGPLISVVQSAKGLPGVTKVIGPEGKSNVWADMNWKVSPLPIGVTEDEIAQAIDRDFAKKKSRLGVGEKESYQHWISSIPFGQRYDKMLEELGRVEVNGRTVELQWKIEYTDTKPDPEPTSFLDLDNPVIIDSALGGAIRLAGLPDGGGLNAVLTFNELLDLDSNPEEGLHLARHSLLPAPAPDGLQLASGVYGLSATDGVLEALSGLAILDLNLVDNLDTANLFMLIDPQQGWNLLDGHLLDLTAMRISAGYSVMGLTDSSTHGAGMYIAAFAAVPIPEPTTVVCGLVTLVVFSRRRGALHRS